MNFKWAPTYDQPNEIAIQILCPKNAPNPLLWIFISYMHGTHLQKPITEEVIYHTWASNTWKYPSNFSSGSKVKIQREKKKELRNGKKAGNFRCVRDLLAFRLNFIEMRWTVNGFHPLKSFVFIVRLSDGCHVVALHHFILNLFLSCVFFWHNLRKEIHCRNWLSAIVWSFTMASRVSLLIRLGVLGWSVHRNQRTYPKHLKTFFLSFQFTFEYVAAT